MVLVGCRSLNSVALEYIRLVLSEELAQFFLFFFFSFLINFHRNAFSARSHPKLGCESFSMEFFVSTAVMVAADGGISPSMAQSAQLQKPLMESFTWFTETAAGKICTEFVK